MIDSNERVAEKIAELTKHLQSAIDMDEEGFADDFTGGIEAAQVSQLLDEEGGNVIKAPVYDGPSPEELVEQAQQQVDEMLEQAQQEAEDIKGKAYEDAAAKGHAEGYSKGQEEAQILKDRLQREYEEKEQKLMKLYQQKVDEIEPKLVDVLTDVYEHVFAVQMTDQRDVLIHLIGNALQNTESSNEYVIHVSPEDLPFVSMQKEALQEAGGAINANYDIVEDLTLGKNQCLIETEHGIFDCSVGVELKELKKELQLLSYEKDGSFV
jgi:flagellar assembly protein FliH